MGCAGERSLFAPADGPGAASGPGLDPSLIGTWQVVLLVDAGPDLQTWTTTWRFDRDGTCGFTRTIRSALEGVDRTTIRPCRWTSANARVTVTYTTDNTTSQLPYSFAGFDPNRLVLEGVEYARLAGR